VADYRIADNQRQAGAAGFSSTGDHGRRRLGTGQRGRDRPAGLRKLDFSGSVQLVGVRMRPLDSVLPDVRVDADLEVSGRGLDSIAATVNARSPELGIDTLTVAGSYRKAGGRVTVEQLELGDRSVPSRATAHGRAAGFRPTSGWTLSTWGSLRSSDSLPVQGRVPAASAWRGPRKRWTLCLTCLLQT